MTSDDQFQAEMRRRYAAVRASTPGDTLLAVLHIGLTESAVVAGCADDELKIVRFLLGYAGVPATLFSRDIPSALELENAITAVEDAIMPGVRHLSGAKELVTTSPELHALAAAASADPAATLTLERVEWLFDELSRAVLGGPASQLPFTPTKRLDAALLILRELMHHGGFHTLSCLRSSA